MKKSEYDDNDDDDDDDDEKNTFCIPQTPKRTEFVTRDYLAEVISIILDNKMIFRE